MLLGLVGPTPLSGTIRLRSSGGGLELGRLGATLPEVLLLDGKVNSLLAVLRLDLSRIGAVLLRPRAGDLGEADVDFWLGERV